MLLSPVAPFTAPPVIGDDQFIEFFGNDHRNTLRLLRFTLLWNMAATPAISLPWGFDGDGLPLAVHLITRAGTDEALLSMAARLETEAPERGRRPNAAEL